MDITSAPNLQLPPFQGHTVSVSILNGLNSKLPAAIIVQPPIYGHDELKMLSYSFLIRNPRNSQTAVFDLAMMKDHQNKMAPALQHLFADGPGEAIVENDIPEQLIQSGLQLDEVNAVILSHSHIDHVGDPSLFPPSVDLVVGPGFQNIHRPGYPTNPAGFMLDSMFTDRNVRELDFSASELEIGGFRAIDFWDDGSFFLLETPGHSGDHICGLARTTDETWMLMAGDVCHHAGQLRPSAWRPLPDIIKPNPLLPLPNAGDPMTGCDNRPFRTLLEERRQGSAYGICEHLQDDLAVAEDTRKKIQALDGSDDVLVILAHDRTLLDILELHPASLNDWKEKRWGELGRWRFLAHFKDAIGMET